MNKLSIDSEVAAASPPLLLSSTWPGSRAIPSGYLRFMVVMGSTPFRQHQTTQLLHCLIGEHFEF
jgi:hypothetical protein